MSAEDDKVLTHWATHGTHDGPLIGIPATGKRVAVKGVAIKRLANGKVLEE
jgi:predicted ester cyclase